ARERPPPQRVAHPSARRVPLVPPGPARDLRPHRSRERGPCPIRRGWYATVARTQRGRAREERMKLVLFEAGDKRDVVPGLLTDRGVVPIADAVPASYT